MYQILSRKNKNKAMKMNSLHPNNPAGEINSTQQGYLRQYKIKSIVRKVSHYLPGRRLSHSDRCQHI